jgi:hypothetical protein
MSHIDVKIVVMLAKMQAGKIVKHTLQTVLNVAERL